MIFRLKNLLRGRADAPPEDPLAPFLEGAAVSVLVHPEAWLFEPLYRSIYPRGPVSTRTMPLDRAIRCDVTASDEALGHALRAAYSAVVTVKGHAPVPPVDPKDQSTGADALRPVLGIARRASVWNGTVRVSTRVGAGQLVVTPMRPEGRAGGFSGWKGSPKQSPALPLDDAALGAALRFAAEAARRGR